MTRAERADTFHQLRLLALPYPADKYLDLAERCGLGVLASWQLSDLLIAAKQACIRAENRDPYERLVLMTTGFRGERVGVE